VILVVDDEMGVHEACHALLADQYDLLGTHDGLTALTTLDSHRVDLVLLDLRLPGPDGLQVLSQITATRPQLKVIVLTAIMSVRSAVEAMKLGAFDYLTKPFSGEDLCLLIKAALASDRDDGGVLRDCHHDARHPQDSAASVLFVGNELGPLVTMKLVLERFAKADVAVNPTIALRWLTQHLPTLLMVHDSLLPADGTRLVRLVQSIAPACPMLLVGGSAPHAKLTPELAALPRYTLTGDPSAFDSLLRELLNVLSIRHRMVGPAPAFSPYVLRALSYLSTHYAEALQVKMVAEAIGISAGHLAHLFPAEIQVTVKEFVTKIRIEVAKQLLYDRGYTLEYVAEKVGFSDASHLSRVFQRFTGDRPGTYRRRIIST
jgi:DNA-binding NtrC family response regulator